MLDGVQTYHVFDGRICGDKIFLNPYTLEFFYYLVQEQQLKTLLQLRV